MDSWPYRVPANNPQPPPPPPPPPPSIQGIFPNGHQHFQIDYSRNPSFGDFVSSSSEQIIPETNAFYYGFGPDVKETVAVTGFRKNNPEYSVHKRRREIESHNIIVFPPEVAGFRDVSAENAINRRSPTPGSKRRPTRCSCKKTMCKNGYCVCFREKAGCSGRCKCNRCRNKFNNEQGTSNGNSAYWKKKKAAVIAELMDSDYETDFPDEMVERYCETLKELLVAEPSEKSQKIDQEKPQKIDRDDTTYPEEKAQSSLTDAEEP